MTTSIEATERERMAPETLLKIATGDTSKLTPKEKLQLIVQVCEISGLDPRLAPFEFIRFQGKEVLYARKNAADQLVNVHKIKLDIVDDRMVGTVYRVRCRAATADGRSTMDDGCVSLDKLAGSELANAMMRCVTKAKRRTVLSVCGLSMLDESELDTIQGPKTITRAHELVAAAEASQAAEAPEPAPPPDDFEREYGREPEPQPLKVEKPPESSDIKARLARLSRIKELSVRHKDFVKLAETVLGREIRNVVRDLSSADLDTLENWDANTKPEPSDG